MCVSAALSNPSVYFRLTSVGVHGEVTLEAGFECHVKSGPICLLNNGNLLVRHSEKQYTIQKCARVSIVTLYRHAFCYSQSRGEERFRHRRIISYGLVSGIRAMRMHFRVREDKVVIS